MLKNKANNLSKLASGGFEEGAYDKTAIYPTDSNRNRQTDYLIPDNPKLLWKVTMKDSFVDGTVVRGSLVIDRNNAILVSDCDNYVLGPSSGRIIQVDPQQNIKELLCIDRPLRSPIIGEDGLIYIATADAFEYNGNSLYCLFPDGKIKWEFLLEDSVSSKPVIDKYGNIYICTYDRQVGTFFSISREGILNWKHTSDSINWYEPIISNEGVIYLGLERAKTLCAFNRNGEKLWERVLGQGNGDFPLNIHADGVLYVCVSGILYVLNPDGSLKWEYKPEDGHVFSPPSIDEDGNLYLNISRRRLISLDCEGRERWCATISGSDNSPPIIGRDKKLLQSSSMNNNPCFDSWLECFTTSGEKKWVYPLKGEIITTVVASDNLIYILTNCHKTSKKGWKDRINVKWELYAIGQ